MLNLSNIKTISQLNTDVCLVKWSMTLWCNYSCPYCIQKNSRIKHPEFPSIEDLLIQGKKLNDIIENSNKNNISLMLIGGEVTYIDLIKIFSEVLVTKKITKVEIVTNLSRDYDYFKDITEYFKSRNIELVLSASLHESQITDLNEFIMKAKAFAAEVSLVLTNDNIQKITEIIKILKTNNINYYVEIDRKNSNEILENRDAVEIFESKSDKSDEHAFLIELKDGSVLKLSRSELVNEIGEDNLFFYNKALCTTSVVMKHGKMYKGNCSCKSYEVMKATEDNIANLESTDWCNCNKSCSMCSLIKLQLIDNSN